MRTPEGLRAEVSRLHLMLWTTSDPAERQNLAARALELAQEAEAIADLPLDVDSLQATIAYYKRMLADAENAGTQRVLMHVLQRAEDKLERMSSHQQPPK